MFIVFWLFVCIHGSLSAPHSALASVPVTPDFHAMEEISPHVARLAKIQMNSNSGNSLVTALNVDGAVDVNARADVGRYCIEQFIAYVKWDFLQPL